MLNSILPLCGELAKVGGHGYATTEASCTPPWLPSGWGCRGRRLSRERRSPDTRRGSLQGHHPARMNVLSRDGLTILKENSARYPRGQAAFEIRRLPRCPGERAGRPARAHKPGRDCPGAEDFPVRTAMLSAGVEWHWWHCPG